MIRIWFNHWFSTAYSIIQLIKKDESDFQIIGSNEREQAVYKKVCDEWHIEPVLKDEEYVSYCLDFCEKNRIDIFAPRRKLVAISRHKDQFERIGVKVLVDDYEAVNMLNRKDLAYKFFKENGIGIVPEYCSVTTADEFLHAYESLKEKHSSVCFKFVNDEGGNSFRRIVDHENAFSELRWRQGSRITIRKAYSALSEVERFGPVIVMPYLPGEEISVDCLKTKDGIIAVPRYKGTSRAERIKYDPDISRAERIKYDPDIIRYCQDFYGKVNLEMPCNIQYKFSGEIPYILEVNTRMSGGLPMTCAAAGINIPGLALDKLLGRGCPMPAYSLDERVFSNVELPIIIK